MAPAPRLVIFDFDGTLFDTHESIAHTLAVTFKQLLPDDVPPPSESAIVASIAGGLSLPQTIAQLYPLSESSVRPLNVTITNKFLTTYRTLYKTEGTPFIKPFPRVHELLSGLKEKSIPCAIVSNKGIAAVRDVLAANNLSSFIELIVGDGEPANSPRKPDPESWTIAIKPVFARQTAMRAALVDLEPQEVFVVGDTEADIRYAQNLGATSVWCSYGYGLKDKCTTLKPDYTIQDLEEVLRLVS